MALAYSGHCSPRAQSPGRIGSFYSSLFQDRALKKSGCLPILQVVASPVETKGPALPHVPSWKWRERAAMNCPATKSVASVVVILVALAFSPRGTAQNVKYHSQRRILVGCKVEYPPIAAQMHLEGTVRVSITVGPDGSVMKTQLMGGGPVFARPVLDAIPLMKWQPAPQQTTETLEIDFRFGQK